MKNFGRSESLIDLHIEFKDEDTFTSCSDDLYKLFNSYHEIPVTRSQFCICYKKAYIEWKNNIQNIDELTDIYLNKSKYKDEAKSRMLDVKKYSKNILNGDVFPPIILYFDGQQFQQVDGARRLMASLLSGLDEIYTIVIMRRKHLYRVLDDNFKQRIKARFYYEKWFNDYQDIIELNLKGKRRYKARFPKPLDLSIFNNRIVTDFGCNSGMALFEAYFAGAKKCIGFDYIQQNAEIINEMATRFGIPVEAHQIDFNDDQLVCKIDNIIEKWDYSMFLSVYRTLELKDRDGLLKLIWNKSNKGMLFEGHGNRSIDTDRYYRNILEQLGGNIKRLPDGPIDKPYDNWYRPKYLITK